MLCVVFFDLKQSIPAHGVSGISVTEGIVMEFVITFALVYTVYATTADPKKGQIGIIAPITISFIVGANILAAGPISGGSMNLARSFGPAIVSADLTQSWISIGLAHLLEVDLLASSMVMSLLAPMKLFLLKLMFKHLHFHFLKGMSIKNLVSLVENVLS